MKWRFILLLMTLSSGFSINATHIVGTYWEYQCLGLVGNQVEYEIILYVYRDCNGNTTPPPFTGYSSTYYSIYDQNDLLVENDTLTLIDIDSIDAKNSDPCLVSSPFACAFKETWRGTVRLDTSKSYVLSYERCCRNPNIVNVFIPDDVGVIQTVSIPRFSQFGCNNSPVFNLEPDFSVCSLFDLSLDFSATDSDGDVLVYELTAPFNSQALLPNGGRNAVPVIVDPPPYNTIPYNPPFNGSNQINANPSLAIDANGILTGQALDQGLHLISYSVKEFRNGVLINTVIKDLQINFGNCDAVITSAVQSQSEFCTGLTIPFGNESTSNTVSLDLFKWDFGDTTTLADTSNLRTPSYTFPDTGFYSVTLIVNPGLRCSDTSIVVYRVDSVLNPSIVVEGSACFDNNSLNFIASGQYSPSATFEWDFGSNASINSSTLDSVGNVQFSNGNSFPIQLIVRQSVCSETVNRTIQLFDRPVAKFSYNDSAGCYPFPVQFNNESIFTGSADFFWNFGDGSNISNDFSPRHTYNANGLYNVQLELRTTSNCIDTSIITIPNAIDISLDSSTNDIQFALSDSLICQGETVSFLDQSTYEGTADYFWDFGNNSLSTDRSPTFTYNDTGTYDIGLLLITKDKCIDTLQLTLNDALKVLQSPISRFTLDTNAKAVKDAEFVLDATASEFYSLSEFYLNNLLIHNGDAFQYTINDTGTYTFTHIVTEEVCSDTTNLKALVFDEFEFIIPNVFTPNGDRINDEFKVRACGVYEYEIEIYNRYGTLMFKSNNMNINWDGYTDGRKASDGVYFYSITIKDFRGEYIDYSGNLTLLSN